MTLTIRESQFNTMNTSRSSPAAITSITYATRSPPTTPTRDSDFARLCELFDKLATPRPVARSMSPVRATKTSAILTKAGLRSLELPEDLAPIVQNLATVVAKHPPSTPKAQDVFATPNRKPRLTVAHSPHIRSPLQSPIESLGGSDISEVITPSSSSGLSSDEEAEEMEEQRDEGNMHPSELLSAGLAESYEERYPFTFKMMLHQTYEKEDWGKMVKGVLEQSQNEYKPLAEQEWKQKDTDSRGRDEDLVGMKERYRDRAGRMRSPTRPAFGGSVNNTPTGQRRALSPSTPSRRRARSFAVADTKARETSTTALKLPSIDSGDAKLPKLDARILKKQCVGRNKSVDEGTNYRPLSCWIYDAKVSSALIENEIKKPSDSPISSPLSPRSVFNIPLPIPEEQERTRIISIDSKTATSEAAHVDAKSGNPLTRAAMAILRKKSMFPFTGRRRAMSVADAENVGTGPAKIKRPFGL